MSEALIAAVGWLAAAAVAWWQLRANRSATKVQRTIGFHEVLTTGEVGAARDRLATLMWFLGDRIEPGRCHRPTFAELLGTTYSRGSSSAAGIDLSSYPEDVVPDAGTTPLQDLYRLLWTFERIEAAEKHGLVDADLVAEMLNHHIVWWDTLASEISDDDTRHRKSLARLAADARARSSTLHAWAAADFIQP